MKTRMLLSTAAIALLTVGAAMAQTENRKPDDASRPQAESTDRQRGQNQKSQARPQGQQQGAQAPQGSQPKSTTGQAPQQPQSGQAQSSQPGSQPQSAPSSGQRTQSTDQQRDQQRPARAQGSQRDQGAPSAAQGSQRDKGTAQSGQTPRQGTSTQQSSSPSSQQGTSTQQSTAPAQQQNARQGAAGQAGSVQINDQQRSRISATISQSNVRPLTNVNFSVSVGTVVPRSVRVQTLPASIVSIVPQYRGYSYVVVEDRIVIVEPKTKKIVTVIEQSGGRSGARSASSKKLELSTEQRASIRRHATGGQRATTGSGAASTSIAVGERVPQSIELHSFPTTVYEEVPVVREYRYFMRESDVVVVDPDEQRIIEIIR